MIAGPSGVGKGSIVKAILDRDPDGLAVSRSVTTRTPRPSETDGLDYHFVDALTFDRLAADGALLEWAEVFGNRYGTPAAGVEELRADGKDVILEIDVQGAMQVRERVPGAVLIFLEPPSMRELEARLRGRGTESDEKIAQRLRTAGEELDRRGAFDHAVVNDRLDHASSQVAAIIESARTKHRTSSEREDRP